MAESTSHGSQDWSIQSLDVRLEAKEHVPFHLLRQLFCSRTADFLAAQSTVKNRSAHRVNAAPNLDVCPQSQSWPSSLENQEHHTSPLDQSEGKDEGHMVRFVNPKGLNSQNNQMLSV